MAICEHGYTANFDCPECPCPCGSGKACGDCICEPLRPGLHQVLGPTPSQDEEVYVPGKGDGIA